MIAKKNALPLSLQAIYKDLSDKNKTEIREAILEGLVRNEYEEAFQYLLKISKIHGLKI